jgi:hypothetical protein
MFPILFTWLSTAPLLFPGILEMEVGLVFERYLCLLEQVVQMQLPMI